MVLVPGSDLGLEDKLFNVTGSVVAMGAVAFLLQLSQQALRVKERTQPVCRHLIPALKRSKN